MVNDCSGRGEVFQLIADAGLDSFHLRATSVKDYNLDVEMAGTSDGTRVIWFAANNYSNQRFTFEVRRERVFALIPSNADSSCVTEASQQVVISACKSDLASQEWELVPTSCD